jgi:hypothetical protein
MKNYKSNPFLSSRIFFIKDSICKSVSVNDGLIKVTIPNSKGLSFSKYSDETTNIKKLLNRILIYENGEIEVLNYKK